MSTSFPATVGLITLNRTTEHDLVVNREYDVCRQEMALEVSCQVGNRYYKRHVTFWDSSMTIAEQMALAQCLGDMVRREIADA